MSKAAAVARPLATMLVLLAIVAGLSAAIAPGTAEARTATVAEAGFIDRINAERAQRGIPRLRMVRDLTSVARTHSVRMANRPLLHHNPNLGSDVKNWRRLAENVGRGQSVTTLHAAFMNSSGHRANILDRGVTEIGVGVEVRGSTVWVTHVFRMPRTEPSLRFGDVGSGTTHAKAIESIARNGITMGCGSGRYCPSRTITRAEMASFLARGRGLMPREGSTFTDGNRIPVHRSNIEAIAKAGITQGCSGGRFCPTRSVTRGEMASFLARARGLSPIGGSRYSDVRAGSTHAGAINAITAAGITKGCGNGRYCPDRAVTRAEMATFLVRAFRL